MRSPNYFALSPRTRDLSGFRLRRIAGWACLHHVLVKVKNLSKNVHVSCSLLELRGRHVVVFQVKVFQVAYVRQLVDTVLESFTV